MEINKEAIGRRIKQALDVAGLTQRALATELGVSAGSVSGYVNGLNEPNAAALAQIASLCKVSLSWLITGEIVSEREPGATAEGDVSPKRDKLDPRLTQMVIEKLRAKPLAEELQLTANEEAVILMLRHLPEKERLHVLYTIMGAWALAQKKEQD